MNGPRINNDERGFTVNKTGALVGIVGLVLTSGAMFNSVSSSFAELRVQNDNLAAQIAEQNLDRQQYRRDIETRLRALETQRVGDASDIASIRREIGAEIGVLRRDLATLGTAIADLKELLEAANGSYR
jgi:hypothetical protein